MPLSSMIIDIRAAIEKAVLKSLLEAEYTRNPELRFAFDHLAVMAVSNVLNQLLDGPNPKQRGEADIAREKPFRLLSDKEINVYSCESTIRDAYGISPMQVIPFEKLEPYARLRFFEMIFPREDAGAAGGDVARLKPLQEVHKSYMKKVYDGGMPWSELQALVKLHKELRHLQKSFNAESRLDAFTRNEAATELLKQVYGIAGKIGLTMDAQPHRALRRVTPGKGKDASPQEIDSANLRHFASGKFVKEDDHLLGAIQQDRKLMKKLYDLLTAYQFLIGLEVFEAEGENTDFLAERKSYFRKEMDILVEKIVEHGGEMHTQTERGRMKKHLYEWIASFEIFAGESIKAAMLEAAVEPEGRAFPKGAAVSDLWTNF